MNTADLQSIAKEAEGIAMGVHESLREAAYKTAFEALLQTLDSGRPHSQGSSKRKTGNHIPITTKNNSDIEAMMQQLDRTAHQEITNSNKVLDRSLYILRIASDDFNMDGLKPSQIAKILTDKFRVKTSRQAVQQALDVAGDKVDRVPRSGGAIFRIMGGGESYLDGIKKGVQ
jgi:hypothetical protein